MLEEFWTAYHSGNYKMNQRSIGVEHEGKGTNLRSDAQYNKSAEVIADICKFYNIPCDNTHIIPHSQVVATSCPGNLDTNRIITYAQRILSGAPQVDIPVEDWKAKYEDKARLETELRGVIEGKDETIKNINKQITDLNANIVTLIKEKKMLAEQLITCQKQVKVNSKCANSLIDAEGIIKDLREDKESWIDKEVKYNKQIKTLQTRLDNIKSPIKTLLTNILEAIKK